MLFLPSHVTSNVASSARTDVMAVSVNAANNAVGKIFALMREFLLFEFSKLFYYKQAQTAIVHSGH
jgi:hypothetical protein